VSFAYPTNPTKNILRQITLKPLKNKFNAIVGSTGSGKSTITQLLLKFYAPTEGSIIVGGQDIAFIDAGWLRERIGFVGQ
jgi:ABC-type multidrug transport system fused ATPase/permease subunit